MTEELELLEGALTDVRIEHQSGIRLIHGRLDGRPVVLGLSGIGKVNAAAAAQALAAQQPAALVFLGVAGALAPDLEVGDLIVAVDALQHDVDVTALGYAPGRIPDEDPSWPCDARLVDLALACARSEAVTARRGRVATGDQFVADSARRSLIRERFGADCVEMEGAAAAQVCLRARLPFLLLRSISDRADGSADVDFRAFTRAAADNAARITRALLARLD